MMDDEEEEKDRRVADSRRQQSIFLGYTSVKEAYIAPPLARIGMS
jgi:hypothetical protein